MGDELVLSYAPPLMEAILADVPFDKSVLVHDLNFRTIGLTSGALMDSALYKILTGSNRSWGIVGTAKRATLISHLYPEITTQPKNMVASQLRRTDFNYFTGSTIIPCLKKYWDKDITTLLGEKTAATSRLTLLYDSAIYSKHVRLNSQKFSLERKDEYKQLVVKTLNYDFERCYLLAYFLENNHINLKDVSHFKDAPTSWLTTLIDD